MIQMFSVSKTYPSQITAFSDLYLEVMAGEFIFITGPSGAGKSSLLRILFGAEKPSSGEVVVNGIRLTQPGFKKIHQLRRMVGIISPDFKLLRDRNVRENIAFVLEVTGHPQKEIDEKVSVTLGQLNLQEREKDSILSLSAGEQQCVAIARGLVKDSPLLLADEPTSLLDDEMTGKVIDLFSEHHQKGTTIVFATQNTDLVQRYPHRVVSLAAEKTGAPENSEGVKTEE
jgi:cell division transport system ATP-binding protein